MAAVADLAAAPPSRTCAAPGRRDNGNGGTLRHRGVGALCRHAAWARLPRRTRRFRRRAHLAAASSDLAGRHRQDRRLACTESDDSVPVPGLSSPSARPCQRLWTEHDSGVRRERRRGGLIAVRRYRIFARLSFRPAFARARLAYRGPSRWFARAGRTVTSARATGSWIGGAGGQGGGATPRAVRGPTPRVAASTHRFALRAASGEDPQRRPSASPPLGGLTFPPAHRVRASARRARKAPCFAFPSPQIGQTG